MGGIGYRGIWVLFWWVGPSFSSVAHLCLTLCDPMDCSRLVENHNQRKLTNLVTWNTAFSNSMKLWAMPHRAIQDRWVMVESSDKTWSAGEGTGKILHHSCLENPMNSMNSIKENWMIIIKAKTMKTSWWRVRRWCNWGEEHGNFERIGSKHKGA